jgi:hypothetical protein
LREIKKRRKKIVAEHWFEIKKVGVPAISAARWKDFHAVYAGADFFQLFRILFGMQHVGMGDIGI